MIVAYQANTILALSQCYSCTLSSLNLQLSSSSTTSRELLSQFSTRSVWKWIQMGGKRKKDTVINDQFHENFRSIITRVQEIKSFFWDTKWCFNASWELKGLINDGPQSKRLAQHYPANMTHWPNVDGGPTVAQHWVDVSCLLGNLTARGLTLHVRMWRL